MVTPCIIRLLGTLQAERGGRVITRFRTRQTGALLAYLALHRERAHPRDALVDLLWPVDTLDTGRHKLRLALASLRQQLEPPGVPAGAVLITNRLSVQLNPAAVTTDVAQFEAALRAADRSRSGLDRVRLISEAVDRYQGELLPGYFDPWIAPERQRLADAYLQALAQLIQLAEAQNDGPGALRWARRAVAADPLREEAHQALIRLLIAAGQRDAAERQYELLEQLLARELGDEPSEETQQLLREAEAADSACPGPPGWRCDSAAGSRPENKTGKPAQHAAAPPGASPPTVATVTLLMGEMIRPAEACRQALTAALERHGGQLIRKVGDALLAVFPRATDALAVAVSLQNAAGAGESGTSGSAPECASPHAEPNAQFAVRMALHSGEVEFDHGTHQGIALDHVAGLLLAAHPGQILCSEATAGLLRRSAEPGKAGCSLDDLGAYRLASTSARESVPERLFQVRCPGMPPRGFPPPQAPPAHAAHLPVPLTRFFGREEEIGPLRAMLADEAVRLLTLTGSGGTGKTRLALEVARAVGIPFYGGVWFVPLADLAEANLIPEAILHALRLPRVPNRAPLEQVVEALSAHPCLLVLDNFEHLVEAGAALVRDLLHQVPSLTCLVTSRQVLGLSGEREFPVAPLPVPVECGKSRVENPAKTDPLDLSALHPTTVWVSQLPILAACPSVQLFVDRAQAVRADFQITARNGAALVELCRRLEGIPLALELAAAWSRTWSPGQMLVQLERRFEFLVGRQRDLPGRHRTLRGAIDWSYHLLSSDLQRLFAQLSVFRGGWTVDAAAAV